MAVPVGIKLDDETNTNFVSKCFPARHVFGQSNDAGAWLVAQQAEQKRNFQASLTTKTKTYAQIKEERRRKEKTEAQQKVSRQGYGTHPTPGPAMVEGSVTEGLLDGFFLLKHCCVEDPSDVCSVNISGQDLDEVNKEDLVLFDNAAYVNAGENLLPFEAFKNFPIVRELELPLNGLRGLRLALDDYPHLEVLDLSYNNLSKEDVLTLGLLPKLKVLYLTGNQLRSVPTDIAKPFKVDAGEGEPLRFPRYGHLEMLFLDDNKLTDLATFASLAGLKKLKRLNLDKNEIFSVPHLKALSGQHVAIQSDPPSTASTPGGKSAKGKKRSGSRSSSRASSRASSIGKSLNEEDHKDTSSPVPVTSNEDHEIEVNVAALQAALATESTTTFTSNFTTDVPPPFPELEHLSLAYNKIADEEGLLAVAAWPMLKQLVIHNNPLTLNSSGEPPLLNRYLQDRLGIQMIRKKPDMVPKPHIQVPTKPHRKVKEVPRPLPKRPLQLMLEGAPDTPALTSPTHQPHPPPVHQQHSSQPEPRPPSHALPPITPSEERPKTDPLSGDKDRKDEEERLLKERITRTQSWTEENFARAREQKREPKTAPDPAATAKADEPVFLTQVDDQAEEAEHELHPPSPPVDRPKKDKEKRSRKKKERIDSATYSMTVPDKFKGYEIFYDSSDDPDVPLTHDIQGNLRSLSLALRHSTVYRDNKVDLKRLQKPFQPYQKKKVPPKPPHQTKVDKLEGILNQMKARLTTEEVNLAEILDDKKRMREEFPEVTTLLTEIQAKYKQVRNATMTDTKVQKQSMEDALKSLHNLGDKLKPSTQGTTNKATPTR